MSHARTIFTDLGFRDVLAGAELFDILRISPNDLHNHRDIQDVKNIAKFVNSAPDALFHLKRAASKHNNPNTSPLQHVLGFIELRERHRTLKESFSTGDVTIKSLQPVAEEIHKLEQQIALFE